MDEFNKRHPEFGAIESLIASITPIQDYTAHEITEAIVNISSYLTRTGVIIAAYTSNANETYHYRKYQYAWEFNSLKSKIDSDTQKMFTDKKADSKEVKLIALAIVLGLISYYVHGFLNNFLDSDKASVPVWGFMAILVALDLYHSNKLEENT